MDDPNADRRRLDRTYRQFAVLNPLITGWRGHYRREFRPRMAQAPKRVWTLLDIGFGGGDVPRRLHRLARRDGFRLEILAIDPDARALDYVSRLPGVPGLRFTAQSLEEVVTEGTVYDFSVSNHLLHHLEEGAVSEFLSQVSEVTRSVAVMEDIRRTSWGPPVFRVAAGALFHRSFLVADGLTSIRRSYTPDELALILPAGWQVETRAPARCCALYRA